MTGTSAGRNITSPTTTSSASWPADENTTRSPRRRSGRTPGTSAPSNTTVTSQRVRSWNSTRASQSRSRWSAALAPGQASIDTL